MPDPRAEVAFDDIFCFDKDMATYKSDGVTITYNRTLEGGSAAVGKAVTLSAANTVKLAADGESVIGRLVKVEPDGHCVVQVGGYVRLPGGNAAALTLGKAIVGAADAGANPGFIREVNTATPAELGRARGFIQDATDPTMTLVRL